MCIVLSSFINMTYFVGNNSCGDLLISNTSSSILQFAARLHSLLYYKCDLWKPDVFHETIFSITADHMIS